MCILSIDVGIKNLALCLLSAEKEILMWEVLDISREETAPQGPKQTIKCSSCKNNAKFRKAETLYCLRHAKESAYILPTKEVAPHKLEKMTLAKLKELADAYSIDMGAAGKPKKLKADYVAAIREILLEKADGDTTATIKASDISLVDISRIMTNKLDRLLEGKENIDKVIIENQISPIATRMTSIQGMLTQYFIMKQRDQQIQYISAKNKLKDFDVDKASYKERKSSGVDTCKTLLAESERWCTFLTKHKKKDDLADCYLQGVWYLNNQQPQSNTSTAQATPAEPTTTP
jgi:hypothetical protein